MSVPSSSAELASKFYQHFRISKDDITRRLISLESIDTAAVDQDELSQIIQDLAKLRKELVDANAYIPGYDQRSYETQMSELEQKTSALRASSVAKPKFSFKRKPAKASSPSSHISEKSPHVDRPQAAGSLPPSISPSSPEIAPTTNLTLSSHSHAHLTSESLPHSFTSSSDLTISNLDNCIVDLIPIQNTPEDGQEPRVGAHPSEISSLTSVHIRDVKRSIILLGAIGGSVLMHGVEQCVIILSCHQLRVHRSKDTHIYLDIRSHPIIEHCSNMSFTSYPACFSTTDKNGTSTESKHLAVLDFSNIKATPSLNWHPLPDLRRLDDWGGIRQAIDHQEQINVLLDKVLPDVR
ncbi:hypothetical protein BD410DRAFT_827939 [Rickenella mellea]|uniref:C-CAP/cofactor C-like domain-containing protein n=1 Tax=Rickenella mellea TaxID=50990 RepID=A0A4Y7Q6S5_9AGAM|nr:hypothetical protein BD410DRAFT_827939 [Rickenella mellea]